MAKKKSALRASASLTQEEAIASLQSWWERNWIFLTSVLVVTVVVLGGWYIWNTNQNSRAQEAASLYFDMLKEGHEYERANPDPDESDLVHSDLAAMTTGSPTKSALSYEEYIVLIDQTVDKLDEFPETPYSTAARLTRAKYRVRDEQYDAALEDLQWVLDEGKQRSLQLLALRRLLQIYLAQQRYEDVVSTVINYEFPDRVGAFFNEMLGDAYFAMGKVEEARGAYANALQILGEDEGSLFLRLKIQHAGSVGFQQKWKGD